MDAKAALDAAKAVGGAVALGVGLWLLFRRPTGSRIVRHAREYAAAHPRAVPGDVREELRRQFLGGRPQPNALLAVAEAVRDHFRPLDRTSVARMIEAAVQIVTAPPAAPEAEPGAAADAAPKAGPRS